MTPLPESAAAVVLALEGIELYCRRMRQDLTAAIASSAKADGLADAYQDVADVCRRQADKYRNMGTPT